MSFKAGKNYLFSTKKNRTKEAMGGAMTFQEALRRRLDIINPSQRQIKEFVKKHPSTLSPGVK